MNDSNNDSKGKRASECPVHTCERNVHITVQYESQPSKRRRLLMSIGIILASAARVFLHWMLDQ